MPHPFSNHTPPLFNGGMGEVVFVAVTAIVNCRDLITNLEHPTPTSFVLAFELSVACFVCEIALSETEVQEKKIRISWVVESDHGPVCYLGGG